jgi:transcriptional regulator with XRE-family HTH domain
MSFGRKLKELRTQAGLTQAQLAEQSDVPLGTIRDYEQGKRTPLLSAAQKLARALDQSLDVFPPEPEVPAPRKAVRASAPARKKRPAKAKRPGKGARPKGKGK